MATPQQILADPKFQSLPIDERRKVMLSVDPKGFGALLPQEQDKVFAAAAPPHRFTPAEVQAHFADFAPLRGYEEPPKNSGPPRTSRLKGGPVNMPAPGQGTDRGFMDTLGDFGNGVVSAVKSSFTGDRQYRRPTPENVIGDALAPVGNAITKAGAGNYGGAAGELVGPAAMGLLLHRMGGMGGEPVELPPPPGASTGPASTISSSGTIPGTPVPASSSVPWLAKKAITYGTRRIPFVGHEVADYLNKKMQAPGASPSNGQSPTPASPTGLGPGMSGTIRGKIEMAPPPGVAAAPAADTALLDDLARSQAGKSFAKLSPEQQTTVRGLADRIQPPTPKPRGPVPESPVQSLDPRNIGWSRLEAAAKAKDITMAKRFKAAGITPEQVLAMPEAELTSHLEAAGFRKFHGQHLSRTVSAGKADIVKAMKGGQPLTMEPPPGSKP